MASTTDTSEGMPLNFPPEKYTVGWLCAIPTELTAAKAMRDEVHGPLRAQPKHDENNYQLGRIGEHYVVMACLPRIGTVDAAVAGKSMQNTFPNLRFGLMVGIGGGIPSDENDIRLGDIAVSVPSGQAGGVIQYDMGKEQENGFLRTGSLNNPPTLLLTAIQTLSTERTLGRQITEVVNGAFAEEDDDEWRFPTNEPDVLFEDGYISNVSDRQKERTPRPSTNPKFFYGNIGSGNAVIKNSEERRRLAKDGNLICFEMEAAGLMNFFKCSVIRGIYDYADAHKHKKWQPYAASVAAAYAKKLLSIVSAGAVETMEPIRKYNLGLSLFDAPEIKDDYFVGREPDVQKMEKILQPKRNTEDLTRKVVILGGMGGIGKTQLAIMYAKRFRFSYTSILWLNAKDEAALQRSLYSLATRVITPEAASKLEPDQLWIYMSNWLSEPENNRWLLIFDNYDDPDQYHITKYYPSVAHGSIIVTTRQPSRVNGREVVVESLKSVEDGLQILTTRSGREGSKSDPRARQLAVRLDGHPLALATAGAFLKQSAVSFAEYLQQYDAKWQVVDSMDELPDYPTRTLYTTWNLSFIQIERENMRAACLLKLFAYLDNQDIWYDLLGGASKESNLSPWFLDVVSDRFTFEDAIGVLKRFCLVEAHYQTGSYSLHVCVHDWTLNGLSRGIDLDLYQLALDCIVCHIIGDWQNLSSQKYSRFTPHASRLGHSRFLKCPDLQHLFQKESYKIASIAELLYRKGQFIATESIQQLLLAGQEAALGAEHTSILDTVHNLGLLYRNQGKLADAEKMYERALRGYEAALGAEHTSTLCIVNNLGLLYYNQGKLADAEKMYERALRGYEKALGKDKAMTYIPALNTIWNFGSLFESQNNLVNAKIMYSRALVGYEKVVGRDHPKSSSLRDKLYALDNVRK